MNHRNTLAWALGAVLAVALSSGCNVTLQIKDGETAYALKKYALATELLQEDYGKAKEKADKHRIAVMIAKSYLAYSQPEEAEIWYRKAVETEVEPSDMLDYALVMKQNGKYAEAIELLKLFYQYDRSQRLVVEGHVKACEEILAAQAAETYTRIVNLSGINTEYSEFSPLWNDGQMIYSSNSQKPETDVDGWTGKGYCDILSAIGTTMESFHPDESWEAEYNTKFHEAALSQSADGSEIYFTRCGMDDDNKDVCRIYRTYLEFDEWTEPEEVVLFEDSVNVGHPFLTRDGKQLFFSSDAVFGYGGKDLYVSTRIGEQWEAPINLGPRVNTPGDEMFPHISQDGKLFFSSSGNFGYGGLDLFHAELRGRLYTNVQHLPYPLNTGADDFSVFILESDDDSVEITGYMASNRKGGSGGDDIYFFEKRLAPEIKLPPPVVLLKGLVEEKELKDPENPNSMVIGQKALPGVSVSLSDDTDPNRPYLTGIFTADNDGRFESLLDMNVVYLLNFNKQGYFALRDQLRTTEIEAKDGDTIVIERKWLLERIYKEVEFTINNIYYDLDSANIRPDAAIVLDSLATILAENPGLRVELGSHTDARGSDPYNLDLSQRRADSTVRYLISKGIAPERLTAVGYGETRLVNECVNNVACSEEKHQQNRRTTFKILGLDFELKSD